MEINKNSRLVMKDVHLYDIESCHYSIMKNLGMNVSEIPIEDKLERNTYIGKMMRKNPKLTSLLRNTTRSIIDEYIRANDLTDEDIILRQYDGILVHKKVLRFTDLKGIPLNIRKEFLVFISSIDRKKYIAIKGIPYRYPAMDEMYKRICRIINSARKESIFRRLQEIKDYMMTTRDKYLYGIPVDNNKYNIFLKEYGQVEVTKTTLKVMDPSDIDRDRYFNFYIAPFTKSIVVEFVR
jgi:hypothetical protein